MALIATKFGFRSTAAEVIAGIDMSGKRVVVTGGASGIGIPTAAALAGAGAQVTLAVRNVEAALRWRRRSPRRLVAGRCWWSSSTWPTGVGGGVRRPAGTGRCTCW